MGWTTRFMGAALSLMLLAGNAFAQQVEDQKVLNLNALGTALARHILADIGGREPPPNSVISILTDLDTDGFPEIFAHRPTERCVGPACGLFLFSLAGEQVDDLLGNVPFARKMPPGQLEILNQKRGGWFDMALAGGGVSWDGRAYASAAQFPVSTLSTDRFQALCEKRRDRDYELERAGVEIAAGRKTLCACVGARIAELGFDQAALDRYGAYLEALADEDYTNDQNAEAAAKGIVDEARDVQQGCMVQNEWAVWPWIFTGGDPGEAQLPLAFDSFVAQCAKADWLDSNRHVGSPARRLGTCGCLARRMAASGFDQQSLDAVGNFYGGEFSESDVEDVRADAMEISDEQLDKCLAEIPPRQTTAAN